MKTKRIIQEKVIPQEFFSFIPFNLLFGLNHCLGWTGVNEQDLGTEVERETARLLTLDKQNHHELKYRQQFNWTCRIIQSILYTMNNRNSIAIRYQQQHTPESICDYLSYVIYLWQCPKIYRIIIRTWTTKKQKPTKKEMNFLYRKFACMISWNCRHRCSCSPRNIRSGNLYKMMTWHRVTLNCSISMSRGEGMTHLADWVVCRIYCSRNTIHLYVLLPSIWGIYILQIKRHQWIQTSTAS